MELTLETVDLDCERALALAVPGDPLGDVGVGRRQRTALDERQQVVNGLLRFRPRGSSDGELLAPCALARRGLAFANWERLIGADQV